MGTLKLYGMWIIINRILEIWSNKHNYRILWNSEENSTTLVNGVVSRILELCVT